FLLGDLAQRFADVLFEFGFVVHPLHDQLDEPSADSRSITVERAHRTFALDALSDGGIAHLAQLVFLRAGKHLAPRRSHVVEVPMLEGEGEAAADRAGLPENRESFGARLVQPVEALAM